MLVLSQYHIFESYKTNIYRVFSLYWRIYGGWYYHEYEREGSMRLDINLLRGRQSKIRGRVG